MKRGKNAFWVLLVAIGVGIMLYPTAANRWNAKAQAQSIETYTAQVKELDEKSKQRLWDEAAEFNEQVQTGDSPYLLSKELEALYENSLVLDSSQVMAYITIPSLGVHLPVYHDTSSEVLQAGIGHIPWSSLPVGGKGTHCVLSGHSGLPSSELFTKIVNLQCGDVFYLETLGERLEYQVTETETVLPNEAETLRIVPGKDLCTLVTCVPYGINTHRLLVHGERYTEEEKADAILLYNDVKEIPKATVLLCALPPMVIPFFLSAWIGFRKFRIRR